MITVTNAFSPLGRRDLFQLDPEVTFLNHGCFGACPREVFARYQDWQLQLEREPVDFLGRQVPALLKGVRRQLGEALGASADALALVTNATMGLNIVAQSLDLRRDDEVLTTDLEYGAIDRVWDTVCARANAHVVRVGVPIESGCQQAVADAIWAGITPRTRVLALSHVTSGTAAILPVQELVQRASAKGILTVIDGAHAPGQLPLDLRALGADYYVGNCHKWLMAPKGAGLLYTCPELQGQVRPLVISHRLSDVVVSEERFSLEQEMQGTRDPAAFLAVGDALTFAQAHRWDRVRQAAHELLCEALRQVAALTEVPPFLPLEPTWFAQMANAALPPCDGATLGRRLWEEYRIEVPVIAWQGRWFLRVSIQGYNDAADIDRLLTVLGKLLPEVRV